MAIDLIRTLFAYDEWANARFLDAACQLSHEQWTKDLSSGFPSIRETLSHVVATEWVYLRRWNGESPTTVPGWAKAPDAASLRTRLTEVEAERAVFLASLTESDLQRQIAYRNFKGEEWRYTCRDLLLHLVNHSTYHRGQVATMMRQVRAHPPSTDLLVFQDARS